MGTLLTPEGRDYVTAYVEKEVQGAVDAALDRWRNVRTPEGCRYNLQVIVAEPDGSARVRRACVMTGLPGQGWDGMICEGVERARSCPVYDQRETEEEAECRAEKETLLRLLPLRLLLVDGVSPDLAVDQDGMALLTVPVPLGGSGSRNGVLSRIANVIFRSR